MDNPTDSYSLRISLPSSLLELEPLSTGDGANNHHPSSVQVSRVHSLQQPPTEKLPVTSIRRDFRRWRDDNHLTGWRTGVFTGLLVAIFVLVLNIVLLLVSLLETEGSWIGGIAVLAKGSSQTISQISAAYHVLLNVLSTLLLGASNYTMQVLCSPTRADVDRAHRRGRSLDIGVFSLRNVLHLRWKRLLLWAILAVSALPLHLV